ncbi:hypothetical protein NE237_008535 [Protea cynaroides]|uniref:UDP-glucose/GDP-mannose dehydrogenase C-terminal domain-containing protein n=1 Tax=Protea cynaroides TaxID=273540 RepID=A0A9Q0QZE7_9MAGN|nr:hypothetical protein NE237_008535 [Protea cynaroides]
MFNTVSGKKIIVIGFAFKKDTRDTREAPAIDVCHGLLGDKAHLAIYDPQVTKDQIKQDLATSKFDWDHPQHLVLASVTEKKNLSVIKDPYKAAKGAHELGGGVLLEGDELLCWWWMVGKSLASPMLSFQPAINCSFCTSDTAASAPRFSMHKLQLLDGLTPNICTNAIRGRDRISVCTSQKWAIHSTAKTQAIVLDDEERKMWEACRQALSPFNFSDMEEDKTLGKAFGQIQSPYWGEDRAKEVPKFETVNEILNYLRSLGLSDDDLGKLLKKFPEVLGCSLNEELMTNVCVLEKEWGIKGKSLRNLLLRNPKVLGYNVDCKGDCMAKCTRCWVRF